MKNIFIILLLSAFMAGCNSPEKKIKKSVVEYLKENLNDPKSYEPIYFSKIDTLFDYHSTDTFKINNEKEKIYSEYRDTILIYNLYGALHYSENVFDVCTNNVSLDTIRLVRSLSSKNIIPYRNTISRLEKRINKLDKEIIRFKKMPPILNGYTIIHKYRANNEFGAKIINEDTFLISPNYKVITCK